MARKRLRRSEQTASLRHEHFYTANGFPYIFGIDEAGRGPWAGPVAAGAVCLPVSDPRLPDRVKGVKDSKQMTHRQRGALADAIKGIALAWGVGSASSDEINELGIDKSCRLAMCRALEAALVNHDIRPSCLFIDSVLLPELPHIPQVSLVGGDARSLSIAAASVLAKVWRDAYMVELDARFPQYGFARHKGYGTARHKAALQEHGPCAIHRMTYRPIVSLLSGDD